MFKVTNHNDGAEAHFTARFNGVAYSFPQDVPVYCEDEVARHIFAIGDENKTAVLARHGWATPTRSMAEGMAILNAFTFDYVPVKLDAPMADEMAARPALPRPDAGTAAHAGTDDDDHGPAPVVQNAAAAKGGTDGSPKAAAAVADAPKNRWADDEDDAPRAPRPPEQRPGGGRQPRAA